MKRTTRAQRARFAGLAGAVLTGLLLAGCAGADTPGGSGGGSGDEAAVGSTPSGEPSDTAGTADEEGDMDGDAPRNVKPKVKADAIDPLEAGATGTGLPKGLKGSSSSPAGAAWSPEAGLIYVVTNDSSSCPIIAGPTATLDGDEVVVELLPRRDGMCTMDWVPTTSVVQVPDDVADGAAFSVRLGDKGVADVDERGPGGKAGAIAWVEK